MLNIEDFTSRKEKICIVGLGYVGLPLAVRFGIRYEVVGYDNNERRIKELKDGFDRNREIKEDSLAQASIRFISSPELISECKAIIVAVPTHVSSTNQPDLSCLKKASETVSRCLSRDTVVVYESTVYPGVTEEECVPILENGSGLRWKQGFFVGYSPERVNPGDMNHKIDKIVKIVSGDSEKTADFLERLYGAVIDAGIHKAPNIKTAEAAKVIENTQRDLNIALMNEIAIIFNKMEIDTDDVLKAAGTKWNFLGFYPGLVGGHCIGVDPYYLTYIAESLGYHPEVILAGRRINDGMGKYVAEVTVKKLIKLGRVVRGCRVLILGLTFKENISDIRNTKVIDIYRELMEYGVDVCVFDPQAYTDEVAEEYNISLIDSIEAYQPYDAVIAAVDHNVFYETAKLKTLKSFMVKESPVLIDVRRMYKKQEAKREGFLYWGL